jgi:hypothetical protein
VWGERVGCYGGSFGVRCILCVCNVCGVRGVGCYGCSFVRRFILCVGNVFGVRGVGFYGVHLLEGIYCV